MQKPGSGKKTSLARSRDYIGSLAALIVFGIFAGCILAVLLSGAGAYKRLALRDQLAYRQRTAAQYVTTRIHQAETPSSISTQAIDGTSVLVIRETAEEDAFLTYIYCLDGWLCELYTFADADPVLDGGEKLMELSRAEFSLAGNLLSAELTAPSGETSRVMLSLHRTMEAAK